MQFATTGGTAEGFERSVADPVSVQHGVHFALTKESECAYGMHVLSQVHILILKQVSFTSAQSQRQPIDKATAMLYLLLARV